MISITDRKSKSVFSRTATAETTKAQRRHKDTEEVCVNREFYELYAILPNS